MARWKLMTGHYLHLVAPTEWEYTETTNSGEQKRIRIPVPRFLDPKDPKCWNNKWGRGRGEDGECVVCAPGKGEKGDFEFLGDPTPDMMPLDDEAEAISAKFEDRWQYKPDGGEISHSQSLIDRFEGAMADIRTKSQKVEVEGLAELVAAMAAQSKAIESLLVRRI